MSVTAGTWVLVTVTVEAEGGNSNSTTLRPRPVIPRSTSGWIA
jgi:hypothetical protein